jgi:hypothetical protein
MALDTSNPMDLEDIDDRVPLRSLLVATAVEIDALSDAGRRLQPLIAWAVEAGSSERTIEDAQGIDHLLQHLCALSGFIMHLASATPSDVHVDLEGAAARLNLSDLKRRLLGGPSAPASEPAGDLELFA